MPIPLEKPGLRWYECGKCGKRFFQASEITDQVRIEIRCGRCKTLNVIGRKIAA